MKCKTCGKEMESYSLISGKGYPCGHQHHKVSKKEQNLRRKLIADINKAITTGK